MKRIIFLCILLFALVLPVVAQVTIEPSPGIDLSTAFLSIGGVAGLVLFITGWIKTATGAAGVWARWLSWAVAIAVSLLAWWFNLGIFEPLKWYMAIVYGFGIGLVANGIFTSEWVQAVLIFFKAQVKRE